MNLEFVQFENIDKNKWNGTIHYAINRNLFGYYWYLRSVIREWDAIIEGDYQSVMPVPRRVLTDFENRLLPSLGPYSVNVLSKQRVDAFYKFWRENANKFGYRFNNHLSSILYASDQTLGRTNLHILDLNSNYDKIQFKYTTELSTFLKGVKQVDFVFKASDIPEQILMAERIKEDEKNILYRLFYQAIQRSTGRHFKVTNISNGKAVSAFIAADQHDAYLIYQSASNDIDATRVLLDIWLRNNAGRPGFLYILVPGYSEFGIGHMDILFSPPPKLSFFYRLKEKLNRL